MTDQGGGTAAQLQDMFGRAVAFHQAGRLVEAERLYRAILAADPNHADSLHLLGLIAREDGKNDIAAELIGQAVALAGDNAMFHNNLGAVLQEQGRLDEAVASIGRAVALEPDFADAHNNLGNALRDQGRLDEAAASYATALRLKPGFAMAHNNLGIVRKEQGKLEDAAASYRRAIAIQPNYAEAYNNLGNTLAELDLLGDAAAAYEQALSLRPSYADALNNLGAIRQEQGKLPDARTCYERAIAIRPAFIDAHINLGGVLLDMGDPDAAIAEAETARKLNPPAGTLEFSLGDLLLKCGAEYEAATYLRHYLQHDPTDRKGARLLLAGIGAETVPERASEAFLDRLYTRRAGYWDRTATHDQPYLGAALVADAVTRLLGDAKGLDILDAGCGTGLVGERLRGLAKHLDGVDLSPAMLGKAREKGIYDTLTAGDMVSFMATRPAAYDIVASAATLIHFGDLKPVFEAAATTLRDDGLFVFTLFPNDAEHDGQEVVVARASRLAYGGCFAHGPDYVERMANDAGFAVVSLTRETHEHHDGQPVPGLVVALKRWRRQT